MQELYVKLQKNLGLSLILIIGLSVEFSNFQSMFFRFMSQYRADWGAINHIPAMFLSAFLLLCIVIFGIRKQTTLSWFLAMLTCVISFAVYSRMNLSWRWENMTEVHFVILILSGMLPLLVAYTTHQLAYEEEYYGNQSTTNRYDRAKTERLMREIRKMHAYNLQRTNEENLPPISKPERNVQNTSKAKPKSKSVNEEANTYFNHQVEEMPKVSNGTVYEKKKASSI